MRGDRTPVGVDPWVRPWLRAEGLATFVAAFAGFLWLGLPWYAFLVFLLVPDVSAVGIWRDRGSGRSSTTLAMSWRPAWPSRGWVWRPASCRSRRPV